MPLHDPAGIGLGGALEAVAGVADAQPVTVVGPGDRALPQLDDVGELVRRDVAGRHR